MINKKQKQRTQTCMNWFKQKKVVSTRKEKEEFV
jgi:hypothetical protein